MKNFVILSSRRSGSIYLQSLLNSHPEILCGGEIFTKKSQFMNDFLRKNNIQFKDINPEEYIKSFFSRQPKKKINYLGFRLFYNHLRRERESIWNTLKNTPDLCLIHLQRKNILKKYLSLNLAIKTSSWSRKKMEPEQEYKPININYVECRKYFRREEKNIRNAALFFKNNKMIDVYYEDLAADKNPETDKIQEFLGLEPETLSCDFVKQNMQSLSELISNYSDLKEKFENTEWEIFFED